MFWSGWTDKLRGMLLVRVILGFVLVAALVVADQADSLAMPPLPNDPWRFCPDAIAQGERTQQIPQHLLSSIAIVKSGRKHPVIGKRMPWPWTVMAEGQGRYLSSKLEAINEVRELQARGIRNIDVGCMQVNLYHHPDAFFSLEQAFDPVANVTYAAQFLRSLYAGTGSWQEAAGQYHSATPEHETPLSGSRRAHLGRAAAPRLGRRIGWGGPADLGTRHRPRLQWPYPFAGDALSYAERRLAEPPPAGLAPPGMAPRSMEPLRQPSAPDNSARLSSPSQARSPVTMRTLDEEAAFAIRRAQYLQELRRAVADVKRTYAVRGLNDGRQEAENGSFR